MNDFSRKQFVADNGDPDICLWFNRLLEYCWAEAKLGGGEAADRSNLRVAKVLFGFVPYEHSVYPLDDG